MKVNSFDSSIVTPEKKIKKKENRFAPTDEQSEALTQMENVHQYLHHSKISYSCLEAHKLSCVNVSEVKTFFDEVAPDVMDIILKQEEVAIAKNDFTEKIKKYITEEFDISGEYAFSAICILNFSFLHNMPVIKSGKYLFGLHSNSYSCSDCCLFQDQEASVRMKSLKLHNLNVLKQVQNQTLSDVNLDVSSEEEYRPKSEQVVSDSEESENLSDDTYDFHEDCGGERSFLVFNPFIGTKKVNHLEFYPVNSTFQSSSCAVGSKKTFVKELSPIKVKKRMDKVFICKVCDKKFNKLYNLKLHRVSQHKEFPKGMTVFQCKEENCRFACGSEILFKRHTHKKSAGLKGLERIQCSKCDESLAGKSSLLRHMKRKHKL